MEIVFRDHSRFSAIHSGCPLTLQRDFAEYQAEDRLKGSGKAAEAEERCSGNPLNTFSGRIQ